MLLRLLPLLFAAIPAVASAQSVGSEFPTDFELTDFTQTEAESLEDFQGRAVLLEFFAYW